MSTTNKRHSLNSSRETLDSRPISCISLDSVISKPVTLKDEIDNIRASLDSIKSNILSQQFDIAREFEDRVRQTYDGVLNDLNDVRKKVNTLGDEIAADKKFKSWVPVAPFRKEVLHNIYEVRKPSKLTSSKSVDFVDSCEKEKSNTAKNSHDCRGFEGQGRFSSGKLKMASSTDLYKSRMSSRTSLNSRANSTVSLYRNKSTSGSTHSVSETRTQVPGFGCCFTGDNKTYPYRTYRAKYHSFYRYERPGHSWGPSRSGSRSTLDDDDGWDEEKGCMCGVMPDDWRVRVAPYMWEGWPLPGLDKIDVEKLRDRLNKFDEIRNELIDVQNEYRAKHNSPALTVTEELSRDAQDWAEFLAMKGYAQYSDSQNRGENILVIDIEEELTGRQVIDTWYRECRYFNYKQPGWQRGTSNFTQMIWKSTRETGVGIAKFPYADTYVVVVLYKPPGNVNAPGQFRINVPLPKLNESNKSAIIPSNTQNDKGKYSQTFEATRELQSSGEIIVEKTDDDDDDRITIEDSNPVESYSVEKEPCIEEDRNKESIAEDVVELKTSNEVILKSSGNITDYLDDESDDSVSGDSFDNSADDILISIEDNQEEMIKEQLIGRKFLGKQIVDEMIRDLVNERIELETVQDDLIECGEEPKRIEVEKEISEILKSNEVVEVYQGMSLDKRIDKTLEIAQEITNNTENTTTEDIVEDAFIDSSSSQTDATESEDSEFDYIKGEKQLNKKYVVRIDSHSDIITDV